VNTPYGYYSQSMSSSVYHDSEYSWDISFPWNTPGAYSNTYAGISTPITATASSMTIAVWLKDDYGGGTTGYWFKQVWLGTRLCYSEDVGADGTSWAQATCRMDDLRVGESYTLAIELWQYGSVNPVTNFGVNMYIDDLSLSGGALGSVTTVVGSGYFQAGAVVTAAVDAQAYISPSSYAENTGFSGSGSVPSSGTSSSVTFTIQAASSITWNWAVASGSEFQQTYFNQNNLVYIYSSVVDPSSGDIFAVGTYGSYAWAERVHGYDGSVVWQMYYSGGSGNNYFYGVVEVSGDIVVAGAVPSGSSFQAWLLRISGSTGSIVWQEKFSGSYDFNAITEDPVSGDIFAAGEANSLCAATCGFLVRAHSSNGGAVWQRGFRPSTTSNDFAVFRGVAYTSSGDVVAVGNGFTFTNQVEDWFGEAVMFDGNGNLLWHKEYDTGISYSIYFYSTTVASNGNIVIGGGMISNGSGALLSLSPTDGSLQWMYSYGTGPIWSVAAAPGRVFAATYALYQPSQPIASPAVLSTDNSGNLQWFNAYAPAANAGGALYGVAVDPSTSNLVAVGYYVSNGLSGGLILRSDYADGSIPTCSFSYPVPSTQTSISPTTRTPTVTSTTTTSAASGTDSGAYVSSAVATAMCPNNPVNVTIASSPSNLQAIYVDTILVITPAVFVWQVGSTHTISAETLLSCGTSCQYVFTSWSDGGASTHTVTAPSRPTTYNATYTLQYYLTIAVSPTGAGSVTPSSGWYNAGTTVSITAAPASDDSFLSWIGACNGGSFCYSGPSNPAVVTMNGAIIETASFQNPSLWENFYNSTSSFQWVSQVSGGDIVAVGAGPQAVRVHSDGSPVWQYSYSSLSFSGGFTVNDAAFSSTTAYIVGSYTDSSNNLHGALIVVNLSNGYVAFAESYSLSGDPPGIPSAAVAATSAGASLSPLGSISVSSGTYSVTFAETGLPTGTQWELLYGSSNPPIGENEVTTSQSSIVVSGLSGTEYFQYPSSQAGYACTGYCAGAVTGPTTVTAEYAQSSISTTTTVVTTTSSMTTSTTLTGSQGSYIASFPATNTITLTSSSNVPIVVGGGAGLMGLTSTGQISWQIGYSIGSPPGGGYGETFFIDALAASGSNIYVGGGARAFIQPYGISSYDLPMFLMEVSVSNGAMQWVQFYDFGHPYDAQGQPIVAMVMDGGNIVASIGNPGSWGRIVEFSGSGGVNWVSSVSFLTTASQLAVTSAGNIVGPDNVYGLTELNSGGSFLWDTEYSGGPYKAWAYPAGVAVLSDGSIVIAGSFQDNGVSPSVGGAALMRVNGADGSTTAKCSGGTTPTTLGSQPITLSTVSIYGPVGWLTSSSIDSSLTITATAITTPLYCSNGIVITITSSPVTGPGFVVVDGNAITTPESFVWAVSSQHVLAAQSPVAGGSGVQYVWQSWSDGGAESHIHTVPSSSQTVTAVFQTQYYLTVSSVCGSSSSCGSPTPTSGWFDASNSISASISSPASGGTGMQYVSTGWVGTGSVPTSGTSTSFSFTITAPSSIVWDWKTQYQLTMANNEPTEGSITPSVGTHWYDAGTVVSITATPASSAAFASWSGVGSGSYSGPLNPESVTMNGPITETANFQQGTVTITFYTNGLGSDAYGTILIVDGSGYGYGVFPQSFQWLPNSTHQVSATEYVPGATGVQYAFESWTNGGSVSGLSGTYTTPSSSQSVTVNFDTQYQLTIAVNPTGGGTTNPATGSYWYDKGANVPISATANSGYTFGYWTGAVSGISSQVQVTMHAPESETANFQSVMTVSYRVLPAGQAGTGYTAPSFQYVQNGVAESVTLSSTPTAVDVDPGTRWNLLPNPLTGSSSVERWETNQATSGISAGGTYVFTFYHQYEVSVSFSVLGSGVGYSPPAFGGALAAYGTPVSAVTLAFTPTSFWVDAGSGWSVTNPLIGSTSQEQWVTAAATSGTITSYFSSNFPYQHQYYLTMETNPNAGGVVQPTSGWENASLSVQISATPNSPYSFTGWNGTGSGSYTGTGNPATVTMNAPITEVGNFFILPASGFNFAVVASPILLSLPQGGSGMVTVTVILLSPPTAQVTLSVQQGLPYRTTATFSEPNGPPTFTSQLTIQTSTSTPTGSYPIIIEGEGAGLVRSAQILLQVTASPEQPDFVVGVNPASAATLPGGSVTTTVTVTSLYGYNDQVSLSLSNPPSGISVGFNPPTGTGTFTSTAIVNVASNVAPGNYMLDFAGTGSDGKVHDAVFMVAVGNYEATDFLLSVDPASVAIPIPPTQGFQESGTVVVTAEPLNNFAGTVTLTVAGNPTGTGSRFQASSLKLPPSSASGLTETVQSTATKGLYILHVSGASSCNGNPCSHTTDLAIYLYPASDQVMVTILQPSAGATVSGSAVQILGNINDMLWGPLQITNATYQITGQGYDSRIVPMARNDTWTWRGLWDSTKATTGVGGPYTLTVTGYSREGLTGYADISIYVDNAAQPPIDTYYVNYAVNPAGTYTSASWTPDRYFLAGEAMGVRFPAVGSTPISVTIPGGGDTNLTGEVLDPNIAPQAWFGGDGYLYAVVVFAGVNSPPPAVGNYTIAVTYTSPSGGQVEEMFPFTIVRLSTNWVVVNSYDHADVISTLTLGGVEPLRGREGTIQAYATIGPSSTQVSGLVDSTGVLDVYVPYIAWESGGVVFSVDYGGNSHFPILNMTDEPAISPPFPYTQLGISYSTAGQDFVESVHVSTFRKSSPSLMVPTWIAVQIPETGQWATASATSGHADFSITVTPMVEKFNVQVWAYSLDPGVIYSNQYSNLHVATEQASVVVTDINAQLANGQLQVTGTLTLNSASMNLANVQVSIVATDPHGNTVASSSFIQSVTAGTPTPLSNTLTGTASHGQYMIQVTVTYVPTGWTVGSGSAQVSV